MKADALVVWWTGMKVGEPETAEIEEDTYTKCKTGSQWEPAVKHRELSSVLCDDLEGKSGDMLGIASLFSVLFNVIFHMYRKMKMVLRSKL